ncbi:hypothetical protein V5799_015612 [Amblyomma americanum]|uniref:Uncharacterized protein n=1 Tax=Amblyomma americanum TaxID=6943 RepID=A0AAQ4F799_AMBAM
MLPEISSTSRIILEKGSTIEMLKLESTSRIQFRLSVHRPLFVSPALAEALGCAAKVKICHYCCPADILCSVYASLALNHKLRSLHIDCLSDSLGGESTPPGALIGAICMALKACGSLQTFYVKVVNCFAEKEETALLLTEVFDALTRNPRLRKLSLVFTQLTFKTAEVLSVLVSRYKRSLVELHISSILIISDKVLNVLQNMVTTNVFLSRISVRCSAWKDAAQACAAVDNAKERNQWLLNKAARFVTSLDGGPTTPPDHRCAAAFDELRGTASFREHLMALSGKFEAEVSMDIKKARSYLEENYFVFAGIVRAGVVCEAEDRSTQLSALNVDCWRAIAQYLKLSDVVR